MLAFSIQFQADEALFDQKKIRAIQERIDEQLKTDYLNFENASNEKKTKQFTVILNSVAKNVFSRKWVHPAGGNWPLVDWARVDKLDSFFEDQTKVVENVGVVAQTNEEAASFSYVASLLVHNSSLGEVWFRNWLLGISKGNDSNLKRITFFSVDELGVDCNRVVNFEAGEWFIVNWNAWNKAYDQSNKLGKAILLKCMTRLALITDDWDKLKEIHLSVFNGNDDDLKAIALVKGSSGLGNDVMAKWTDLAQNSTNAKLKSLAQQAIARHNPEDNE